MVGIENKTSENLSKEEMDIVVLKEMMKKLIGKLMLNGWKKMIRRVNYD